MSVELKQRSFGELVGQCFSLAVSHFPQLIIIIGLLGLPSLIAQILVLPFTHPEVVGQPTPEQALERLLASLVFLLVTVILGPIQQGASILLVAGSFTGDQPTIGASLRLSLRKFLPLLGLSFAVTLILTLGLMALVVPGVMWFTWYFVASPALVVEDLSVGAAMTRSKELSAGWRWKILGFLIVTTFLVAVIGGAINGALAVALRGGLETILVSYAVSVVLGMISVVAPVVYYFHLRVVKEAFDVESLSSLVEAIAARAEARS